MAATFTAMTVKNLKPAEREYTVQEKGGFGVRVYPTGRKTFYYAYRLDGQRRFLNLGEYYDKERGKAKVDRLTLEEAREAYKSEQQKVKDLKSGRATGPDPVALKVQKKEKRLHEKAEHDSHSTVAGLVDEFLSKWVKKVKATRSAYNDERALKNDVVPEWGTRKAKDIRRRDAILLMEKVAERAPGQAQYLGKVCRKMFSFALQREIVEINPFVELSKAVPELKQTKRDRVLSADEIKTVWQGIEQGAGSEATKQILKLILVTGQRPSEVCGIRKSEIDGEWWTIPAARMKNKKPHRVFLTALAKSLIPETKGDIIFPGLDRPKPGEAAKEKPIHVGTLSYAIKRSTHYGIAPWTPHDLRRTCRTFLSEIGIPREHAEAVLSHTLQGVEGVYNRYHYDKEKQTALESWERKLQAIITGEGKDNVVSITSGKGIRKAA